MTIRELLHSLPVSRYLLTNTRVTNAKSSQNSSITSREMCDAAVTKVRFDRVQFISTASVPEQGTSNACVQEFLTLPVSVHDKSDINPTRVFNVNETGLATVKGKPSKMVVIRGKKQVGSLTSALHSGNMHVTSRAVHTATDNISPNTHEAELMEGTPPGSTYHCHPTGWTQKEMLTEWFIQHLQLTTHSRNMEVIDIAREIHTAVIACSHWMWLS